MAKERIGLDPLADKYQNLGSKHHKMTYITGYAEKIPFPDQYFDIISSFNSLDHIEDLEKASREIHRTLKTGGILLIIVDIHALPTITEPITLNWSFLHTSFPDFQMYVSSLRFHRACDAQAYQTLLLIALFFVSSF